jgi:hypothetical protein
MYIFFLILHTTGLASIVTGYGLDGRGLIPGKGKIFCFMPHYPDWFWSPPIVLSNGYQWLSPQGAKQLWREADDSPPTSAKVKNGGSIPPLPYKSSRHGA